MQIACVRCGSTVLTDLDVVNHVARCKGCNTIFDTSPPQVASPRVEGGPAVLSTRRLPVQLPSAITLTEGGRPMVLTSDPYRSLPPVAAVDFAITRSWFDTRVTLGLVACLAVFFFGVRFALNRVIPFMIGTALSYLTLAGFINSTTISVSGGVLTIRHGPLPWTGSRTISTSDLTQLFCREDIRQTRTGEQISYSVHAALRSGPPVSLLAGLPDANQALFIEQAIETRLGITDLPMAGELPI